MFLNYVLFVAGSMVSYVDDAYDLSIDSDFATGDDTASIRRVVVSEHYNDDSTYQSIDRQDVTNSINYVQPSSGSQCIDCGNTF